MLVYRETRYRGRNIMFDRVALKDYINEMGLKQKSIADKAGLSQSKLSLILTGERKCEVNEYAKICKAIGVPLNKFIDKQSDSA